MVPATLRDWGNRIGEVALVALCLSAFLAPAASAAALALLVVGFVLAPPGGHALEHPVVRAAAVFAVFVVLHTIVWSLREPAAGADLWKAAGDWLQLMIFIPFAYVLARDLIRVVPSPVIPESLFRTVLDRPDHPWFGDHSKTLILGAGELCARKGFDTLLRAFAMVRTTRPCRLMILGRGRARDALLALAGELGVTDDFALPGHVPDPYAFMAHADLFALTSRWEGLGFVLIEALATGTPVVATDCPSGPREVLQNGRYGPLVPVDDAGALAAAMAYTLDAPLAAAALREAARPYGIDAATDTYLDAMRLPRWHA